MLVDFVVVGIYFSFPDKNMILICSFRGLKSYILIMHSSEREGATELINITSVGTASQSGTFLLRWIHFVVKALWVLDIKTNRLPVPGTTYADI